MAFEGFILGLLLDPLGLLIVALMREDKVSCPHYDSQISPRAATCPQCGKATELKKAPVKEEKEEFDEATLHYKDWEKRWRSRNQDKPRASKWYLDGEYETYKKKQQTLQKKWEQEKREAKNKRPEKAKKIVDHEESKATDSIENRLRTVIDLHSKGLLDDEEFKSKKAAIVKEL